MTLSSKSSILGIPFWRFYYDESKRDAVLNSIKNLSFRDNDTNWIWRGVTLDGLSGSDLYKHPEFIELHQWMQECMNQVIQDMGMICGVACNSSWAHLNKPGQYIYEHIHSNCFYSSNYYVSGHAKDKTIWIHDNPYFHSSNLRPCGEWKDLENHYSTYYLLHEEPTEPGKFIVFPPTLRHMSQPNTSPGDRYTIGSNWALDGLLNEGGVSRLNLQVLQ